MPWNWLEFLILDVSTSLMFEGRTSCPETQTDDGVWSVRIANLSQRLASVNVVAVDRHRRIAVWVCFLRTLQCFVHMCTLMASFRLEMKMLPVEAAYTKELLLLLRCQPHAIYSMVTLPFFAYNLIRLQGLFYFWYPEMAEQSDGRKQKTDASCHAPTRIKGRRSNFGSSASAGCCT